MKKVLCGNDMDRMPDWAFRVMQAMFRITDFFFSPGDVVKSFGIRPGMTVMDYGCGPGRHVQAASLLIGETGTVYACDIQELAIAAVEKLIRKKGLKNVKTLVSPNNSISLPDRTVDFVYALDMFHMVSDPGSLLKELRRITRAEGILILEDGHQKRELSREKVLQSGCWEILEETDKHMRCRPVQVPQSI